MRVIDPLLLRTDPEAVKRSQRSRGSDEQVVDQALAADEARRQALAAFETLRAEQKSFGEQVKVASKEEKPALIAKAQQLSATVKEAEAAAKAAEAEFETLALRLEERGDRRGAKRRRSELRDAARGR